MGKAPFRYAEDTIGQSIKTELSDSVRKLSKLSRQASGVAATDLTPRERGDLIAELQSLATTFDTLAANATGEEMLDTAREGRTRVEAALAELELGLGRGVHEHQVDVGDVGGRVSPRAAMDSKNLLRERPY